MAAHEAESHGVSVPVGARFPRGSFRHRSQNRDSSRPRRASQAERGRGAALQRPQACTILPSAPKSLGLKGFWGGVARLGVHSGRLVHGPRQEEAEGPRTTWSTGSRSPIGPSTYRRRHRPARRGRRLLLREPDAPAATRHRRPAPPSTFGARFITIEGSVEVKAGGTLEWVTADRNILLTRTTSCAPAPELGARSASSTDRSSTSGRTASSPSRRRRRIPRPRQRRVASRSSRGRSNFQVPAARRPGGATTISTPTVTTTAGDEAAGNVHGERRRRQRASRLPRQRGRPDQSGQKIAARRERGDAGRRHRARRGRRSRCPAVPTLLAPPHQAEIAYPDPAAPRPSWPGRRSRAPPPTTSWSTSARPSTGRSWTARTGGPARRWSCAASTWATYYWQVAAVDKDGVEGSFSELRALRGHEPQAGASATGRPPPLVIETAGRCGATSSR